MQPIADIMSKTDEQTIEELQGHKNDRDEAMAGLRAEKKLIHDALIVKVTSEQARLAALADPALNQTVTHGQKPNALTDAIKKFGHDHVFSKLEDMLGGKEKKDGK